MKQKLSLPDILLCIGLLCAFALLLYAVYGSRAPLPAAPAATPVPAQTEAAVSPQSTLKIHVLDVGQGNCAVLQSPNGKTMLIDTGEKENAAAITRFLQEQGIEKLDMAVATHPHQDHMGGMAVLLRKFSPSVLLLPDAPNDIPEYDAMRKAADAVNAQIVHPGVEQVIPWDADVTVTAFAPFTGLAQLQLDLNEQSLVLHIRFGDTAILFTGDAGYAAEETLLKLLRKSALRADVLLVGHHGSSDATTPRFLHAIAPSYAVISCGRGNAYGHPHQSVLNLLAQQQIKVYRTDTQGDVHIVMDGKTVSVTAEKEA
ncbi:MAG: ComEC/Rec2 family competence protein [Clostridia bacterium]|nr:ComEC/Rec2 family competence protein [Clostridia bacterium]